MTPLLVGSLQHLELYHLVTGWARSALDCKIARAIHARTYFFYGFVGVSSVLLFVGWSAVQALVKKLLFLSTILMLSQQSLAIEGERLKDISLLEFSNIISERLDVTVILSPSVKANSRAKIFVTGELSNEQLYQLFLNTLLLHDYAAINQDGIIRVVRKRKVRSMPLKVIGED